MARTGKGKFILYLVHKDSDRFREVCGNTEEEINGTIEKIVKRKNWEKQDYKVCHMQELVYSDTIKRYVEVGR